MRGASQRGRPLVQATSNRTWSPQQLAIFEWFEHGTGHLVVRARAGCLSGDTIISCNRAGRGFSLPIKELAMKANGVPFVHAYTRSGRGVMQADRPWDLSIPTFVQQEQTGVVRLAKIEDVWFSGVKQTYTVNMANGQQIRATNEHPFLTSEGWARLDELHVGDRLHFRGPQAWAGRQPKVYYPDESGMFSHPFANIRAGDRYHRRGTARVPRHRLVIEAELNGLNYDVFLEKIRNDDIAGLVFLDPETMHVHHKDRNPRNYERSNLQMLTPEEHRRLHAEEGTTDNVLYKIIEEEIISINVYGEEETFDIEVSEPWEHNFIANGFVVHNTGKTTTILEGINHAPERNILLAAFNKRIAEELSARLSNPCAEAKTLHALGYLYLRRAYPAAKVARNVPDRAEWLTTSAYQEWYAREYQAKTGRLIRSDEAPELPREIAEKVSKLHTLAREVHPHAETGADLAPLQEAFDILVDDETAERYPLFHDEWIADRAVDAMGLAQGEDGWAETGIDFADMLYLPVVLSLVKPEYDLIVVDEAQDMTVTQLELALMACRRTGRVCIVGDDKQAIYGFRGADSNSIDRLKEELGADELPLTVTYRCGQAIVKEAQELVPDFSASDTVCPGEIRHSSPSQMYGELSPVLEDYVLSRINAPLATIALNLIRANVRVRIAGRDIGAGLIALVRKLSRRGSIPAFLQALDTWEEKEVRRLEAQRKPNSIPGVQDKAETLRVLADGVTGPQELIARIETLFSDSGRGQVVCSTVHKAKGLETKRVFILKDTLYPKWGNEQEEKNIAYVACTRAIETLTWVTDK